jgi:hypothetical protein
LNRHIFEQSGTQGVSLAAAVILLRTRYTSLARSKDSS